jgi:hypothetical protein
MPTPNALPPLPPDAGEKVYALVAVRGVLRWLLTTEGMSRRASSSEPMTQTLWLVAPDA